MRVMCLHYRRDIVHLPFLVAVKSGVHAGSMQRVCRTSRPMRQAPDSARASPKLTNAQHQGDLVTDTPCVGCRADDYENTRRHELWHARLPRQWHT